MMGYLPNVTVAPITVDNYYNIKEKSNIIEETRSGTMVSHSNIIENKIINDESVCPWYKKNR